MGVRSKNLPVVCDRIVQGLDFSSLDDDDDATQKKMNEIQSIQVARIGRLNIMIAQQSFEQWYQWLSCVGRWRLLCRAFSHDREAPSIAAQLANVSSYKSPKRLKMHTRVWGLAWFSVLASQALYSTMFAKCNSYVKDIILYYLIPQDWLIPSILAGSFM